MKNTRNLRIERRWRAGKWGVQSPVAQILLKGKWLEAAGFGCGDQVEIVVEDGCLTIRPVPAQAVAGLL
ncbi:SymE family type I addiction module toxin [uncultured Hymenobacter sp.]|uniref:SymE family type I addiction module toxin n=1 Tax=uncultured Hymenobacter sp. TaxID=170016 RepID=UPI0035CB3FD8